MAKNKTETISDIALPIGGGIAGALMASNSVTLMSLATAALSSNLTAFVTVFWIPGFGVAAAGLCAGVVVGSGVNSVYKYLTSGSDYSNDSAFLSSLDESLKKQEQQISQIAKTLVNVANAQDATIKQIRENILHCIEPALKEIDATVNQVLQATDQLKETTPRLHVASTSAVQAVLYLQQKLDEALKTIETLTNEIQTLQNSMPEKERELNDITTKLDANQKELEATLIPVSQQLALLPNQQQRIDAASDVRDRFTTLGAEITTSRARISQLIAENNRIIQSYNGLVEASNPLTTELSDERAKNARLEDTVRVLSSALARLNAVTATPSQPSNAHSHTMFRLHS